jgi:hypothetical protein
MPEGVVVDGGKGQSVSVPDPMSEGEISDRDENRPCSGSDARSRVCAGEMVDESILGDGRCYDSSGEENMLGGIFDE